MLEWRQRFPEDVTAENAFWAQRRHGCQARWADKRIRKAIVVSYEGNVSDWTNDDPRWDDLWTSSDNTTSEDEE